MVYGLKKLNRKQKDNIAKFILLPIAIFYTFFPHEIHQQYSPDWTLANLNFPHIVHVAYGIILGIIAIMILKRKL